MTAHRPEPARMPAPSAIPPEFLAQYDAERAAILCRRAVWYCVSVLALVGISWGMSIYEIATGVAFTGGDSISGAEILTDSLYTVMFVATLIYFARQVRPRAEVVRTFQWVVAVSGIIAVMVTPLIMNTSILPSATLDRTPESDFAQAFASLLTVFLVHALACVFVALSPREGLIPFLPILGAFVIWVAFVSVGPIEQKIALILIAPLVGLPGFAWSWWRYRSFTERFHTRAVQKRYSEVSRELADARRIHEVLFPPPITRGPVRVEYRYEPMHQIGGDFLFVRPLSFPPSAPAGPVLVVLIDVTGHGIAAALAVNRFHAELERLNAQGKVAEPLEVILALNAFTHAVFAESAMFASAVALRVEPGGNPVVRWASAGHPPAFLRQPDGRVQRLDSTATVLGVLAPEDYDCTEESAPLQSGSTVIAYTDGASETTNAKGEMFGLKRLEAMIGTGTPRGTPISDALAAAVEAHRHGPPADDTLIVEVTLVETAGETGGERADSESLVRD